jgi:predicted nucleotidyltransferase
MIIPPASIIAGLPAKTVRDILRKFHHQKKFIAEGKDITQNMLDLGYIAQQGGELEVTEAGLRLCLARVGKKFPRERGVETLLQLAGRVQELKENPHYSHQVVALVLFGSMLTEKECSDIDLMYVLRSKGKTDKERQDLQARKQRESRRNSIVERVWHGEIEAAALLKNRDAKLQLHCLRTIVATKPEMLENAAALYLSRDGVDKIGYSSEDLKAIAKACKATLPNDLQKIMQAMPQDNAKLH